jgi:predicted alpha/beta superfamily hydrolase
MEVRIPSLIDTFRLELRTPVIDDRPVFVSGNFCKWLPDLDEFKMDMIAPGHYQYTFPADMELPTVIEYKYTRGGWDQVELSSDGSTPLNRYFKKGKKWKADNVPHWRRNGVSLDTLYMPIIELFSDSFEMPQLEARRKIHVLLPWNYYEQPARHYPVLYLMDSQNLFGEESAYGNWGIDRKMAVLASRERGDVIIVAIDHGHKERVSEFSPYQNPNRRKGKGREFLRFVTDTLKPRIDAHYRTLSHRLHTGIGGSAMGGLLAAYAGLMHPHVFSRLMIFSPAFWTAPRIYFDAAHFFEPFESRFYLYGGQKEGTSMAQSLQNFYETIEKQSFGFDRTRARLEIDPVGQTSEERWGEEFPKALEWLYY